MYELSVFNMNTILSKMFSIIGLKFNRDFATKAGWSDIHTWTKHQEKEFTNWLTIYLRKEFRTTDKKAAELAMCFNANYGWKGAE